MMLVLIGSKRCDGSPGCDVNSLVSAYWGQELCCICWTCGMPTLSSSHMSMEKAAY